MSPSAPSLPTPRVTCTKTLKASHALVQPGHPGTQVTSFVHLIRRWAPFISEFTRYPYSHKEDTEDSVPLHLTLDDYKRGLKPFALMRPFMSEGWEKAWTGEGECPLMRFAGSETPQAGSTIGGGCWYFREEVLIEGSEAMSKAICKALHHLRDLGIIQFDPCKFCVRIGGVAVKLIRYLGPKQLSTLESISTSTRTLTPLTSRTPAIKLSDPTKREHSTA